MDLHQTLWKEPQQTATSQAAAWLSTLTSRAPQISHTEDTPTTVRRLPRCTLVEIEEVPKEEEEWDPLSFTPTQPTRIKKTLRIGNAYTATSHLNLGRVGSSLFGPTRGEEQIPRRTRRTRDLPPPRTHMRRISVASPHSHSFRRTGKLPDLQSIT